jgi:HD-GYP domain-containing protein (c-di-GMP phosphodiesterase class II)
MVICTIVEEKTNDLVVQVSHDSEADSTTQHHRKIEEWFIRRCAATGQTIVMNEDILPYTALLGYEPPHTGPYAVISIAIPGHERPIGVVTIICKQKRGSTMNAAQQAVVEEMTAQAAMAVEQALLFSKISKYADEVELSYDTTLKVLMTAIDTKDSTTQGHSERVSKLTVALAREMGINDDRLVDIERGALLHDVGKIGVPDEILRKPDSLNDREWEAMQKHPLLAGLMVSKVGFLERSLPILLYHHERYDGKGYPFGLEGKSIPLEARIFTVVDSFDAMTSDRPYRKAIPAAEAVEEINKHSGTQFDPEVVQAFSRVAARMLSLPAKRAA